MRTLISEHNIKAIGIWLTCLLFLFLAIPQIKPSHIYATGESYYRTITINAAQIPSDASGLTQFPVLISLSGDTGLANHASPSGSDIYFTDGIGNPLPYEIEHYAPGNLIAWVQAPSLSNNPDSPTVFKMLYGGSAHTSPGNVWSNGFQGVWHMKEADAIDSTSNGNNGTAVMTNQVTINGTPEVPVIPISSGKIGGADKFTNFSTNSTVPNGLPGHPDNIQIPDDDYISIPNSTSLAFNSGGEYTWSAWVKLASVPGAGGMGLFGKSTKSARGYEIYLKNGGGLTFEDDSTQSGSKVAVETNITTIQNWIHITIVFNKLTILMYVNGAQVTLLDASGNPVTSVTLTSPILADNSSDVYIGYRRNISNGNGLFDGLIDEVEYSNKARSAGWIQTEYTNQSNPGNFYTLGIETPIQSATYLALSAASGAYGGTVSFSATLTSDGSPLIGKNVSFTLNGNSLGSAATDNNGTATLTNTSLHGIAAGSYPDSIGASFTGDSNYLSSSGNSTLTVNRGQTNLTISTTAGSVSQGQPVTFTATVNVLPPASGLPAGNITFKDGSHVLGTGTLNNTGTAIFATGSLSTGSHSIAASYAGDSNFFSCSSSTLTQVINPVSVGNGGGGGGYIPPSPKPAPTPTLTPDTSPAPSATASPIRNSTPGKIELGDLVNSSGTFLATVKAFSPDKEATVDINPGVIAKLATGEPLSRISIEPVSNPPLPPQAVTAVTLAYDFQPNGSTFDPAITLTLKFNPSEVPVGSIPYLAWWDTQSERWEQLNTVQIDPANGTVAAAVSHFTIFSVFVREEASSPTTSPVSTSVPTITATVLPASTTSTSLQPNLTTTASSSTPSEIKEIPTTNGLMIVLDEAGCLAIILVILAIVRRRNRQSG